MSEQIGIIIARFSTLGNSVTHKLYGTAQHTVVICSVCYANYLCV